MTAETSSVPTLIGFNSASVNGFQSGFLNKSPKVLFDMTEFNPSTLAGRIEKRLEVVSLSASAASEMATGKRDAIRKIFSKEKAHEPFNPRADTLRGLAKVLKTTVSWLAEGHGPEEVSDGVDAQLSPSQERIGRPPPFAGKVQAGAFLAVDEYFNQDPDQVPSHVLPDPNFMRVRQYAWRAYGDSMNGAGILDGMWIVGADAADYIDTYGDIITGDLVIVERTRYQGAERELTVKEVHFFRDRYELRPISSNPEHQVIKVAHDHSVDADGEEIKIIGVVLTAYANLVRRRG